MASEIRVNQIQNRSGLSTVTFSDTGVVVSGITTITDLRASGNTIVAAGSTSAPSISPTGNSNTGIFFPSADTIAFAEGGVEALRINSSANIGIGTINPQTKLHISPGTNENLWVGSLGGSASGVYIAAVNNAGSLNIPLQIGNASDIRFATQGTEALRIDSSQRVGIGITNPSQKLEVVGGEIKAGRVDSTNEGGQVSFGRATDNATGWYIDVYGNTSTPSLRFVDVSNSAVRATIDGSGRLTLPYQPMYMVQNCTSGSLTVSGNSTTTLIPSAGSSYDPLSNLNTSTGIYTAPVTGRYLIFYGTQGKTASNTNAGSIYYNVNNTGIVGQCLYYGEAYSGNSQTFIINLNSGDNLRFQIYGNNNQSYTINGAYYGAYFLG